MNIKKIYDTFELLVIDRQWAHVTRMIANKFQL